MYIHAQNTFSVIENKDQIFSIKINHIILLSSFEGTDI